MEKIYFDDKQRFLIEKWVDISYNQNDYYLKFMTLWVAFNAICVNLYHKSAWKERINFDDRTKLKKIVDILDNNGDINIQSEVKIKNTDKGWSVDIKNPERILLNIQEKYNEDLIFLKFVEDNKDWYEKDIENNRSLYNRLRLSLKKQYKNEDIFYIINMSKKEKYDPEKDLKEMARENIIILCNNNNLGNVKSLLYQIRCNIFHGEKTPGDINDDGIVKDAYPILDYIINKLREIHRIYL